jgi:glutamate formiminotransferase
MEPDAGPSEVDTHVGVVCVGARGPLIAFNVSLSTTLDVAEAIAKNVREPGRVRALGLPMPGGRCQVSMNLLTPAQVGIETAFARVDEAAVRQGAVIIETEIVGLVPDELLPAPDAKVTRLLVEPGHSLGSALGD